MPREDENFTNGAFVVVSNNAKADLFGADDAAKRKDWAEAVQRYQRMIESSDGVVEFGARTWLSASGAARRRLLALGPEARARYTELFGSAAAAALAQTRPSHSPRRLLDVGLRFPLAATAVAALRESLALAVEQGDFDNGHRAFDALLELQAIDSTALRTIDLARALAMAAARRDRSEFDAIRERANSLAAEPVTVAGKSMPLSEFVRSFDAEFEEPDSSGADLGKFESFQVGRQSVKELSEQRAFNRNSTNLLSDVEFEAIPATTVIPIGDSLAVLGRCGLYLHRHVLAGGKHNASQPGNPRDPIAAEFPYSKVLSTTTEAIDRTARSVGGVFDGERLYFAVTVGAAGTRSAACAVTIGRDASLPPKLAWRYAGPEQRDDALEGYAFETPPAIAGDLVLYTATRLTTASECALFAFDRKSGALVYSRFIASAADVSEYEMRNQPTEARRSRPSPVVVADGLAYVQTNVGVFAAVDAQTGAIDWIVKYHRITPTDRGKYTPEQIYITGGWTTAPPIVTGDRIVVTPSDSRYLYVLARSPSQRGDVLLNDPLFKSERTTLLGFDEEHGRLIFESAHVSGANVDSVFFEATDLDGNDKSSWITPPLDLQEQRFGKVAFVGDLMFVPTNRRLLVLDLGAELKWIGAVAPPPTAYENQDSSYFGNLTASGGTILSASPEFTAVVQRR